MHIGWRWLALRLLHLSPEPGKAPPPALSGQGGAGPPADEPESEAAREARWVAAFAIGRAREHGEWTPDGELAAGEVAQVLDLAARDAETLRLASGYVEQLATLDPATQMRARALLLRSLARVEGPESAP